MVFENLLFEQLKSKFVSLSINRHCARLIKFEEARRRSSFVYQKAKNQIKICRRNAEYAAPEYGVYFVFWKDAFLARALVTIIDMTTHQVRTETPHLKFSTPRIQVQNIPARRSTFLATWILQFAKKNN